MRTVLTINLLVGLAGVCAAQQAPQNAPPQPNTVETPASAVQQTAQPSPDARPAPLGQDAAQGGDQTPPPPKVKMTPASTLSTEIGFGDWGLSGSHSKFREYATVPYGFYLRDLRFAPMLKPVGESAFFDISGIGQEDYRAETRLVWSYGATQASGFLSRFRFDEPLPNPVNPSSRNVEGFNVKQSLSRDFALAVRFRTDAEKNNYAVPYSNLDQNTTYWDAAASGKLGRGFVNLYYANLAFSDHTGTLLDSTTNTTGLSYLWSPSSAVDIEAAYSHVAISQPATPQSHIDTLALTGLVQPGGITYEPVGYSYTDPNDPNAPVYDLTNGYFDVTDVVLATPGMVDLPAKWGGGKVPACQLPSLVSGGTAPIGLCNAADITLRHSFRKIVDKDYQPFDYDGWRFQGFGAFTNMRYGYERQFGLPDSELHRFVERYNIWARSHYFTDPIAMTGPTKCVADSDCASVDAAVKVKGSTCDTIKSMCTLPYRARTAAPTR